MILPKFDYYAPHSLDEAVSWLSLNKANGVKILAGGTDLLVDIREKIIPDGHRPRCQQHRSGPWQARHAKNDSIRILMALSRVAGLNGIQLRGAQVHIGAMTSIAELEDSEIIREHLPGLWDGARQLGSPLVRNRGTIGGNLCNARPAADTSIPTLALSGRLVLASIRGERVVDHNDFVTAPGKTIIEPDEILKEIIFDLPKIESKSNLIVSSSYIKLANRKALEISVVGAAVRVVFNRDQTVMNARIALGAVAPKPLLVEAAAEVLTGEVLSRETAALAAKTASSIARPITDHRGSREYRLMMIEVLVRRALLNCAGRAFTSQSVEVAS